MMLPGLPLSSINAVLILRSSSLSLLYKAHGGKPPSILTFLRIVKLALAMLSQNLRGKGMKIACTLVPTLRLWNLSQTPQLPKPESAREQNDGVLIQGHLGFQNGGIAGKGEPGSPSFPLPPSGGLASGAAFPTSCPSLLFSTFLSSVFLPSGFMRLWEGLELRFISKCRLILPQSVMYPSLHHHYLHKPMSL